MARVADPRQAVIAGYLAMETALATAGRPRGDWQTPSELLAAAATAGLLPRTPATELTRLFEQARFSDQPMTSAHRERAVDALRRCQVVAGRRP